METEQVSLTEALSEERIREVGEKIAGLPTAEEFRQTVEDDLWREFTGMDEPPEESIAWGELPDKSKSIFGYVDEKEETIPWWFESFRWGVESRGEKIDEVGDRLSALRNFDASTTTIRKHVLADESIVTVLKQFHELGEAIDDNIGVQTERDNTLPSEVFEIIDGSIKTTSDFKNWFENLLGLCPPFNEVLTSLVMVNSNVKVEAVEGLVPNELLNKIERIGVIEDGRINERTYHYTLVGSPDSILRELKDVFDIKLPTEHESLEMKLYEHWAENVRQTKEVREWINRSSKTNPGKLEPGEQTEFGLVALGAPLRISNNTPGYSSLNIYASSNSKAGYWRNTHDRRSKINEIMWEAGLIEE